MKKWIFFDYNAMMAFSFVMTAYSFNLYFLFIFAFYYLIKLTVNARKKEYNINIISVLIMMIALLLGILHPNITVISLLLLGIIIFFTKKHYNSFKNMIVREGLNPDITLIIMKPTMNGQRPSFYAYKNDLEYQLNLNNNGIINENKKISFRDLKKYCELTGVNINNLEKSDLKSIEMLNF